MSLQGSLDARGHPRVPLVLRGPMGSTTVSAIVDTEFVSALSVPSSLVPRMGLLRRGVRPTVLADGSVSVVRIFLVDVEWLTGTIAAEAFESQSDEVLIGAGLLRGHALTVDYGTARSVEIR